MEVYEIVWNGEQRKDVWFQSLEYCYGHKVHKKLVNLCVAPTCADSLRRDEA